MIKEALNKLAEGISLTEKEAQEVMLQIMQGTASESQIAAYLMGLRMKGETNERQASDEERRQGPLDGDGGGDCRSELQPWCGRGPGTSTRFAPPESGHASLPESQPQWLDSRNRVSGEVGAHHSE